MKLILNGGGSGKQTAITNRLLDEIIDNSKPILYVPLAMDKERYPKCLEWIKGELSSVKCSGIDIAVSGEYIAKKNLSKYAAIFIGGGNTYKLLKELKDSGAFLNIKRYLKSGGVVIGGSAGSIIFGASIDSCAYMDPNDVGLQDLSGFNMIGGMSFAAHYTNQSKEKTEAAKEFLLDYSKKKLVIALPEEDSLYIDNGVMKVIGGRNYYVFNKGRQIEFGPGADFVSQKILPCR